LQIDPGLSSAWMRKGEILMALGRATEAEAAFARAEIPGSYAL